MSDVSSERITVSREALRAELAEMELRMRIWMSSELEDKASAAELASFKAEFYAKTQNLDQLPRVISWRENAQAGHFTEAQQAAMAATAKKVLAAQTSEGWSRRERMFATAAVLVTISMSSLNLLQALGVHLG